jgi:hypothetical protein
VSKNKPIVSTVQKLIRISPPLAYALFKGAHRTEKSQQEFIVDAVYHALMDLQDDQITLLLSQHAAMEDADTNG